MNADYYLNGTLKALKDGTVYTSPNGSVLRVYPAGSIVGEIFSYATRGDNVWWQLKEGGFVKQETGKFDPQTVEKTSQGYNDAKGNTSGINLGIDKIGDLFGSIPTTQIVIILVSLAVVLVIANKSIKNLL